MPQPDLKCPTCDSERTQRLSLLRRFYGDGGFAGPEFVDKGLERPRKPWGFTIGFLVGLLLGAITYELLPEGYTLLAVASLILAWIGIGVRFRMSYGDKRAQWEGTIKQYFLCLRCGDVFRPRPQRVS